MSWDIGDVYTRVATFRNAAGALADPTTVTVTVTAPDGTVTAPVAAHPSVGLYTHAQLLTQAGVWVISIEGTGAVAASEAGSSDVEVYVRRSRVVT